MEAFALEGEAQVDRLLGLVGKRRSSLAKSGGKAQKRGADVLGRTRAGRLAGEVSRQMAGFFERMPLISLPADAARNRRCLDLLAERLAQNEADPLANVHLAEAHLAARRDRAMVRFARAAFDWSVLITSTGMRTFALVGGEGDPAERLLRRGYQLAAAGLRDGPLWSHHEALARVYVLQEMPGAALHHAMLAAATARIELREPPEPDPRGFLDRLRDAYDERGLRGAAGAVNQTFERDLWELSPHEVAIRKEGASLTTAARALRQLGRLGEAREAIGAALARKMTVAHEVAAAMVDPTFELAFGRRLVKRIDLLTEVSVRDRRFYYGEARNDLAMYGKLVSTQAGKTRALTR